MTLSLIRLQNEKTILEKTHEILTYTDKFVSKSNPAENQKGKKNQNFPVCYLGFYFATQVTEFYKPDVDSPIFEVEYTYHLRYSYFLRNIGTSTGSHNLCS
jgi:hypothetical protein